MDQLCHGSEDKNATAAVCFNEMRLNYLFYEYDKAFKCAKRTQSLLDAISGRTISRSVQIPCFYFYDTLVRLALYPDMNASDQKKCLKKVRANQKKLKQYASAEMGHQLLLVEAEKAKIKKDEFQALTCYDLAATLSRKNDSPGETALVLELAAKFFHETGRPLMARAYFKDAVCEYQKLKFSDKVAHLFDQYPQYALLPGSPGLSDGLSDKAAHDMDLAALMNAARTISGETVISRLMDKLMTVVLEHAGAQKGYLILNNQGRWVARARVGMSSSRDFAQVPLSEVQDISSGMVRYVARTGEDLVLACAFKEKKMAADSYIQSEKLKSALCLPVRHQGEVTGVLYLENNRLEGVFTPQRVGVFKTVAKILANAWAQNQAQKELLAYQDKLRVLSAELLLTEKKERRRLAKALQDQLGNALHNAVAAVETLCHENNPEHQNELSQIHQILNQSIEHINTLTFEFSPQVLYDSGLSAALALLAEQTVETYQINMEFLDQGLDRQIEEDICVLMFQSVRELVFNMVKHAGATKARLTAGIKGDELQVCLSDNGAGFEPQKSRTAEGLHGGFGLFSIQERLISHGGHMKIDAAVGKGTHIKLVLPMAVS